MYDAIPVYLAAVAQVDGAEGGSLLSPEITRDTSLRGTTVDWQERQVDIERAKLLHKTLVRNRVT